MGRDALISFSLVSSNTQKTAFQRASSYRRLASEGLGVRNVRCPGCYTGSRLGEVTVAHYIAPFHRWMPH